VKKGEIYAAGQRPGNTTRQYDIGVITRNTILHQLYYYNHHHHQQQQQKRSVNLQRCGVQR